MSDTMKALIRLIALIGVFVVSCGGLGYLAGMCLRRSGWPSRVLPLVCVAIAFIWPAALLSFTYYGMTHYQRRDASDPGDAPAMVMAGAIFVGAPILFLLSLPLAIGGASLARRRRSSLE